MIDKKKFFDGMRAAFGPLTQQEVEGTEAILDLWAICEERFGWTDLRWLADILAQVRVEVGTNMYPIRERDPSPSYGTYYGRGQIQLTWVDNYRHARDRLNELGFQFGDFEQNPELLLQLAPSAAVAVFGMKEGWFRKDLTAPFTPHSLPRYFPVGAAPDPLHSRNIVNGKLDRASEVVANFTKFCAALSIDPNAVGTPLGKPDVTVPEPPAKEPQPPVPPPAPPPAKPTVPIVMTIALSVDGLNRAALSFDPTAPSQMAAMGNFTVVLKTMLEALK
jgi:hypothetical protein